MWTYNQSDGTLLHDGALAGEGYSGFGEGKNNPTMQTLHDVGPIPQGTYDIGLAHDTGTASHGCIIMPRIVRDAISSSGDGVLQVV